MSGGINLDGPTREAVNAAKAAYIEFCEAENALVQRIQGQRIAGTTKKVTAGCEVVWTKDLHNPDPARREIVWVSTDGEVALMYRRSQVSDRPSDDYSVVPTSSLFVVPRRERPAAGRKRRKT